MACHDEYISPTLVKSRGKHFWVRHLATSPSKFCPNRLPASLLGQAQQSHASMSKISASHLKQAVKQAGMHALKLARLGSIADASSTVSDHVQSGYKRIKKKIKAKKAKLIHGLKNKARDVLVKALKKLLTLILKILKKFGGPIFQMGGGRLEHVLLQARYIEHIANGTAHLH